MTSGAPGAGPACAAPAVGRASNSESDTWSCVRPSMLCDTMSLTAGASRRRSTSGRCLMKTAADEGRIFSLSGSLAGITTCTRAEITPSTLRSVCDSSCETA